MEVQVFRIDSDGDLPFALLKIVGQPYSARQRLENRKVGLGGLIFRNAQGNILNHYSGIGTSVKTILEPTRDALLFRIWAPKGNWAFGIRYEELTCVEMIKEPDVIRPTQGSLMWHMLNLGIPLRIARYWAKYGEYECGPIFFHFACGGLRLTYEKNGYEIKPSLQFFRSVPAPVKFTDKRK